MDIRGKSAPWVLGVLVACGSFALAGCDNAGEQPPASAQTQSTDPPEKHTQTPTSNAKQDPMASENSHSVTPPQPPMLQPDASAKGPSQAAASASNTFGLSLYHEIAAKPGNFAFSPASISLALSMTYAGAAGNTAKQMREVLALPEDSESVHRGWASVVSAWNTPTEHHLLATVNRLFGEQTYTFEQPFQDRVRSHYAAPLEGLDFRNKPQVQRAYLNNWVAGQTHERIKDLIPADGIDIETRLVLVNALYFKGPWANPFMTQQTADRTFYVDGKSPPNVAMMKQTHSHDYAAIDGVQLVQMHYRGSDLAMLLVVPDAREGLAAALKNLNGEQLARWDRALQPKRVTITLPKFMIAPPTVDLGKILQKMGMTDAFNRTLADFSGMAKPANPEDRLYISAVFHKAFVAVDEAGSEAAAATAVVSGRSGGMPAKPVEVVADHPFTFMIRDLKTGAVMFVGRVSDPKPA